MLDVLWPDAALQSLIFEYDLLTLQLVETGGSEVAVDAHGPIAFQLMGMWDEMIIERGVLMRDDAFSDEAWQSVRLRNGEQPSESGSPDRNRKVWQTLEVTFIDGCRLLVAAARFESRRG